MEPCALSWCIECGIQVSISSRGSGSRPGGKKSLLIGHTRGGGLSLCECVRNYLPTFLPVGLSYCTGPRHHYTYRPCCPPDPANDSRPHTSPRRHRGHAGLGSGVPLLSCHVMSPPPLVQSALLGISIIVTLK
uniref:Uncharacterized protein n=1 Tax=Physcomitrium patens TaxID=3218 RepID=A0A2K1IKB3_PHYPA|nr:hypothetical protein PHYPA_028405 [Physcomitrium patens]